MMMRLVAALCCGLVQWSYAATRLEMIALSSLYNATRGDSWVWKESNYGSRWKFVDEHSDACVESWQGVTCTNTSYDSSIISLSLHKYNLNGTIPYDISNLRNMTYLLMSMNYIHGPLDPVVHLNSLQTLILKTNGISGTLPSSLTQLSRLTQFNIELNSLSGTIPAALSSWTSLQTLNLGSCSLHGSVPTSLITSWSYLTSLDLSINEFSGPIPQFNQSFLEIFSIAHNQFTSTLSPALFSSTALQSVDISLNSITGSLPSNIGSSALLASLGIQSNLISGTLPESLMNNTNLNLLALTDNYISGTLPQDIFNFSQLAFINMLENLFTGTLPYSLTTAVQLKYFNIGGNFISGSLPETVYQKFFSVNNNFVTSTVPSSIFTASLNLFDISSNIIWGTIPTDVNNSATLYHLNVGGNFLTGTIPSTVYHRTELRVLVLSNNALSGTISEFVSSSFINVVLANNVLHGSLPSLALPHLESVDVSDNWITGTIPNDITSLYAKFLSFDNNYMTSTLPVSIFQLTSLQFLDVSRNALTGTVPSSLCTISLLRSINLHSNRMMGLLPTCYGESIIAAVFSDNFFSGSVPSQLTTATSLSVFKIQGNAITGRVDKVFSEGSKQLVTIDLSDNKLSGTIPKEIFQQQQIKSIALVKNCFAGSIPSSICTASTLKVIAMDGLSAGKSCRNRLWDPLSVFGEIYFSDVVFHTIPPCVFDLPILTTLHLSGNGLSGSIESIKFQSPTLTSLSLSHNRLTGTIPGSMIDRLLQFHEFDVSHNRFAGSIDTTIQYLNVTENNKLSLKVNRFSGDIPQWMNRFADVRVLSGNMFQCSHQSDLPSHDPDSDVYICGSGELDSALWVLFSSLLGVFCLGLVISSRSSFSVYSWIVNPSYGVLRMIAKACHISIVDLLTTNYVSQIIHNTVQTTQSSVTNEIIWMLQVTKNLLNTARLSCLFIVVLVLPCILLLKLASDDGDKTQSHQYRWLISLAYMSGRVSASIVFILWTLLVCSCALMIYRTYVAIEQIEGKMIEKTPKLQRIQIIEYVGIILANMVVVFIVNGAYIYIQLKDVSQAVQIFSQVSLAGFKLVWDTFAVGAAISWISSRRKDNLDGCTLLYTALLVFNNIIAPCFVTAVTDDTCFKGLFEEAERITVEYSNVKCVQYAVDIATVAPYCSSYEDQIFETSYQPPFNYNYQCSSAILKSFIPVFIYAYAFMILALPVMDVMICSVSVDRVPQFLRRNLAGVMWPSVTPDLDKPLIRVDRVISTLMRHLAVLMTFGFAYPLLGVGVVIAMVQYVWKWRLLIVRFVATISIVSKAGSSGTVTGGHAPPFSDAAIREGADVDALMRKLNSDCKGSWRGAYICLWAVIWPGALFIGCLVFDILGDEVGWKDAIWIFAAMLFLPIILWILITYTRFSFMFFVCDRFLVVKETSDVQTSVVHQLHNTENDDL